MFFKALSSIFPRFRLSTPIGAENLFFNMKRVCEADARPLPEKRVKGHKPYVRNSLASVTGNHFFFMAVRVKLLCVVFGMKRGAMATKTGTSVRSLRGCTSQHSNQSRWKS